MVELSWLKLSLTSKTRSRTSPSKAPSSICNGLVFKINLSRSRKIASLDSYIVAVLKIRNFAPLFNYTPNEKQIREGKNTWLGF